MRGMSTTRLEEWRENCLKTAERFKGIEPQTSYLEDLTETMLIKAEIIGMYLEGVVNSYTTNLGGTTGLGPNPFRPTKEEIKNEKQDLNNQPYGKHGHPDQPGILSAAESLKVRQNFQEKYIQTLKRKLSEPLEAIPGIPNSPSELDKESSRTASKKFKDSESFTINEDGN